MSKDKLTDYDSTAGNNTDVGGISIAEGMLPSNVNDAIREVMSHLKDFAAGTQPVTAIALEAGSSDWSFEISGTNLLIKYGGTSKAKLDSSGNLTVVGDVTAFGTI